MNKKEETNMDYIGYDARMRRLMPEGDGRYFGLTVDHSMARGVMKGLDTIQATIDGMCAGHPNAVTMHKGVAEKCFKKHAGITPLVLKCTTFSPYQPDCDTPVATVEEAIRLGADAISVGCIVGGDNQPSQLSNLAEYCRRAKEVGMPVISHIYPRGNRIAREDRTGWETILYATRMAAELGVDLIKTNYTGSPESFRKVVEATPSMVAIAGGDGCETAEDLFRMTRDVLDCGGVGVTYGRFIIQYPDITAIVKAVGAIIHRDYSVADALKLLKERP